MCWFPVRSGDWDVQHTSQPFSVWAQKKLYSCRKTRTSSLSSSSVCSVKRYLWKRALHDYIRTQTIMRAIFQGTQFCKWHKLPVTWVTPTIQREHTLYTGVSTISALFTPAEEMNFCALADWCWGEKQDEKMEERQETVLITPGLCVWASTCTVSEPNCTHSCRSHTRKLHTRKN